MKPSFFKILRKQLAQIDPGIVLINLLSVEHIWQTALKKPGPVKAIVAYEPEEYIFPEDEIPSGQGGKSNSHAPAIEPVSLKKFEKLINIPVLIIFDARTTKDVYKPEEGSHKSGDMAKQFIGVINRHGGDATLVFLPKPDTKENCSAALKAKNEIQYMMDYLVTWLEARGLNKKEISHQTSESSPAIAVSDEKCATQQE